jgi:hypothetical protein
MHKSRPEREERVSEVEIAKAESITDKLLAECGGQK